MICAKDVMSKRVTSVSEGANTKDVIRLLVHNNVTGLPVVTKDGGLLGMVTEKDILRMLLYDRDIKKKTAADLMTTEVTYFDEDDDLMTVFKTLVESNFRRVPILSGENCRHHQQGGYYQIPLQKSEGRGREESDE